MCAIAGTVSREDPAGEFERVREALDALAHRGPDGEGFAVYSPADRGLRLLDRSGAGLDEAAGSGATLILGHRRLAVIDPSDTARQPMLTSDGRYLLAHNGEIYNHLELKKELQDLGHVFRSRSDTEVLLAAYAAWGPACLGRLVGMFAFAVLDTAEDKLFLARDPFGMKPLYYAESGGRLAFASEISALLGLTRAPRRVCAARLLDYLNDGLTDEGAGTILDGVRSLPAAHYAVVSLGGKPSVSPVCYWRPETGARAAVSVPEAAARLKDLFMESVTLHLRSDVRAGTMLSGGVDSSAIACAMREIGGSGLDLHTFSYIAGQGAVSEERWIDLVNASCRATPHKVSMSPADWEARSPALAFSQDEPFGSLAVLAQNRVFEAAAAEGVKVILDGQGADEIFCGYRYMWSIRAASLIKRGRWLEASRFISRLSGARQPGDPSPLGASASALARLMPAGVRRGIRSARGGPYRPWVDRAWCRRNGLEIPDGRPRGEGSSLHAAIREAVRGRSLPGLLRYEDRNSMAHSVEARLPFLTTKMMDFALSLPDEHLIDARGTGKALFREAMRGIVPDAVLDRRDKIGFSVPNRTWLTLVPGFADLLDEAARIPAVSADAVRPYAAALRAGRLLPPAAAFPVWRLAGLALWARRFEVSFE